MFKKTGLPSQPRKLPRGPDLSDLQQLLSQALENRGRSVSVSWRGPSLINFTLDVTCNLKTGANAQWQLLTPGPGGKREMLVNYTSCDVLLVFNLINSKTLEAQQNANSARSSSTRLQPAEQQNALQGSSQDSNAANTSSPPDPRTAAGGLSSAQANTARRDWERPGMYAAGKSQAADYQQPQGSQTADTPASSGRIAGFSLPTQPAASVLPTANSQPEIIPQSAALGSQLPTGIASQPAASPQSVAGSASSQSAAASEPAFGSQSAIGAMPTANQPHSNNAINRTDSPTSDHDSSRPKPKRDPTDSIPRKGSLIHFPVPELITMIANARASGRLSVSNEKSAGTMFALDGSPVHATTSDATGDDAVVSLLTWRGGTFEFEPNVYADTQTVHATLESLLHEGKRFAQHMKSLKEAGMQPNLPLTQCNPSLQKQEFIEQVCVDAPCDINTLSRVYLGIDGNQTIDELIQQLSISRVQMVHILQHLILTQAVAFAKDVPADSSLILQPRPIDNAAIQSIMMSLRRADTGLFIYPAFLYFLEQEYLRSYRSRSAFSVVVFEIRQRKRVDGNMTKRVLPPAAIQDMVLRIGQVKRHIDLMAHYDAYDYALLLPNTKAKGAEVFINRMIKALSEKPLTGDINFSELSLAVGCSSVPEDFKELSNLLGAADLAMRQAQASSTALVMYCDIKRNVKIQPEQPKPSDESN